MFCTIGAQPPPGWALAAAADAIARTTVHKRRTAFIAEPPKPPLPRKTVNCYTLRHCYLLYVTTHEIAFYSASRLSGLNGACPGRDFRLSAVSSGLLRAHDKGLSRID